MARGRIRRGGKRDVTALQRRRRWHDGLAIVNAATDATEVAAALALHGKKLDLDMVSYGNLRDTSAIDAAVLAGIGAGYASQLALLAVFEPILRIRVAAEYAVDAVNRAESAAKLGALAVYGGMLGINLTDYHRLTDDGKGDVHDDVFAGIPYLDDAAIKTAVDAAVATALEADAVAAVNDAANATEMSAALFAYADVLEIDVDVTSDYQRLTAANQAIVLAAMIADRPADPGYVDAAAVKAEFDAEVAEQLTVQAVAVVNAADASAMGAAITTYAVALGIDLTDYNTLEQAKKDAVHTAMVTGQPYADAAAIVAAFDAAVLAQA